MYVVWAKVGHGWQRVTQPLKWREAVVSTGDVLVQHVRIMPVGALPE